MENNKLVSEITAMDKDFAKWYTDIVLKADLAAYSGVKGFMILRPYGCAIWENIKSYLDNEFKKSGHENVCMPMLIPESLLNREKEHVEGFSPEVAWVTHGGDEKLAERMCVRPTSEVLFCDHYKDIIHSYRDLPKLYNQWCSVLRWEKTTRPFLRTREFFWQEGHTMHATEKEAMDETLQMLNIYAKLANEALCIPVIKGKKTDKEKLAGAVATYTIEALMHDGKALQSGTSHFFGDGFARAFDITFTDKDNQLRHPFQTSWGVSTRIIGAVIMTHGDDSGLKLPPMIAPVQVQIIPIAVHKPGVLEAARELCGRLKESVRAKLDDSDNSPGWKFAQQEMLGIPLRLELGPRDIQNNSCVLVRRDTGEKITASIDTIEQTILKTLDDIAANMYNTALKRQQEMTYDAHNFAELKEIAANKPGFIRAMWCGDAACEQKLKDECEVSSRCEPFGAEPIDDKCVCCGKKADKLLYWGKAY